MTTKAIYWCPVCGREYASPVVLLEHPKCTGDDRTIAGKKHAPKVMTPVGHRTFGEPTS